MNLPRIPLFLAAVATAAAIVPGEASPDQSSTARALIASTAYASIQEALDANPGRLVFVPAGDHVIDRAVRISGTGSGLWGPGRIIQSNPAAAIVEVREAVRPQVRDVTLTRAAGREDTDQPGLLLVRCTDALVDNVQVVDNWTGSSPIRSEKCVRIVVRNCVVENYYRITIEDWTKPSGAGITSGFAYNCMNGTAMNFVDVAGALIEGNRIVENRLLPTPEIKEKYQLGKFVKKNAQKGPHIDQQSWDNEYWSGWRQGAAIHVGRGLTSDIVQILGNLIEHTQQGIDLHGDHAVVANNIINDAGHGIKAMHGSRHMLITGNQFNRCDLFAIGLMQGAASHVAGRLPSKGPSPVGANIDGHSIISNNIISDFGYGSQAWIWGGNAINRSPIQLGGKSPLADTPPLRNVLVTGNVIYDPGQDGILVDGQPRREPPRYRYAVRVVQGEPAGVPTPGSSGSGGGHIRSPEGLRFSGNLFDPGTDGIANVDLGSGAVF